MDIFWGRILPIPELVPFRLTRDIIDGFGICGIEGVFKNVCESTLEMLKSAQDQIMTIFEVLLYDPLHNWTLSPKKAYMLQQADALPNASAPQSSLATNMTSLNPLETTLNNEQPKVKSNFTKKLLF